MSHERRRWARSPGIRRLIGDWARARRAAATPRRRCQNARFGVGIDEIETRTMLSSLTIVGPPPLPQPPVSAAADATINLQLQPGSAISQLMPLITSEDATVSLTAISGLYTVGGPTANIGKLAAALSTNPAVEYAQPVQTVGLLTAPNDPDYVNGSQWQLDGTWGVNAPAAWNVTTGSDKVIVADVDSGLNYNLPDIYDNVWLNQPEIPATVIGNLTDVSSDGAITFTDLNNPINQGLGKIEDTNGDGFITGADVLASTSAGGWVNPSVPNTQDGDTADPNDLIGWNFVTDTNNPLDDLGHGTFTASEIGEMTNNATGGAGLVWNAQIMPLAFIDSSANGTDTAAALAIDHAVAHGAKVINASWGATGNDPTLEAAIEYADENGVIIVAAAGNSGADDDTVFFSPAAYSAQYPNVISVAAIDSNGALASFSNYGETTVQLAAPGVNVYSMLSDGSYGTQSGTSMAAPLVTGTVALVEAAHPSWTMSQVIDALLDTVTPDPALEGKVATGGVVNAGAAVANTDGPYVVSASPDGSINRPGSLATVQLTFNEEINPATFTAAQVTLSGPGGVIPTSEVSVNPVSTTNDHEFQVSFPAQTAAGTYTLRVGSDIQDWYGNDMNQNRNGINGEISDAFTETIRLTASGSTDLLSIAGVPAVTPAGTSETFTVTALDPNGGTDTGYIGTVDFTSTDSQAVLPADYTFTAADDGIHTFSVTFKTAGTQAITATDSANPAIAGTEDNITVAPGAAQSLRVTGFPTTDTAGGPETFTVSAVDAYGNVATSYVGTVQLTSSDSRAVLPAAYTITPEEQGMVSFTATLETAGSQSITATDSTTSGITGSQTNIDVKPAAASRLTIAGFPTTDTAGSANQVTVTLYDAYGNVATGYTGTVSLSSSDPGAVLPATYTYGAADAGTHMYVVTLDSAGTQIITAVDTSATSLTASETGITVQSAAAASFAVAGFPQLDTAGAANSVTVTAYDAYGNVATGYTGTMALTSSDGTAVLPADYAFTAGDLGTHTFALTLDRAGTQSISARDTMNPAITGAQLGINVSPAAGSQAVFVQEPTGTTAGEPIGPPVTVAIEDAYGNVVPSDSSTVSLTLNGGTFSGGSSTVTTAATSGVATFAGLTIDKTGSYTMSASDGLLASPGASNSFAISPGPAARLVIATQPSSTATAGQAFVIQPVIDEEDRFGNLETGDNHSVVTVSLPSATSALNGSIIATVSGGVATFANLAPDTAGTISITFESGVLDPAKSSSINVEPGAATKLVVTTPPLDPLAAGQVFDLVISAEDPYGNVASAFDGSVTVSVPNDPAFTTTVQAKSGVASFSGLTLNAAANGETIRAVAGGLSAAVTNPLTVTPVVPPPTIISEQVVLIDKRSRHGKPRSAPVFAGFALRFSTAMNAATAGLAANYQIDWTTKKHLTKKTETVQKPVAFTSNYDPSTDTVTLMIDGKQKFAGGGQIAVIVAAPDGVASAAGVLLSATDTTFAVLPRTKAITPSR